MALYNIRTLSGYYQITKFDDDLNVEQTYEANNAKCNCPAGSRGRNCRHKEMIETFIAHGKVNSEWFFDYDNNRWVQPWTHQEEPIKPFKRRI